MPTGFKRHFKFAVLNCIAAVVFMTFGAVITYLGRNDPPQPVLASIFLGILFLVCPATLFLTAATLFQSVTSWTTSVAVVLNWAMCVFAILFAVVSLFGNGFNPEILLGTFVLFLPFAVNIHALAGHQGDPASIRSGDYVKRK